jgi:hypothetical protein
VIALEIAALRLVAPLVGLSLPTGSAVVGVVLGGLALGGWGGGRLADALAPRSVLAGALLAASFGAAAIVPLIAWQPRPDWVDPRDSLVWALWLAGSSFLLPSLALGAVPPAATRLALGAASSAATSLGFAVISPATPRPGVGVASPAAIRLALGPAADDLAVGAAAPTGRAAGSGGAAGARGGVAGAFVAGLILIDAIGSRGTILVVAALLAALGAAALW